MIAAKHTQGPLELESKGWDGQFIYGNDERAKGRRFIAEVSMTYDGAEANARRLVACWNACESVTTERLEDLGRPLMDHLFGADAHAAKLHAINKDLIEAAKLVLAWYEAEEDHSKEPDFYKRIEMCRVSESAIRAAIARSEGAKP